MKVVTEKAMMPFLSDVDNIKMTKVCCVHMSVLVSYSVYEWAG